MKKKKRGSIFAKPDAEKISSTVCQGLWKEQKRNPEVYQTECRKGSTDDCLAIERAKSKRTEVTELYYDQLYLETDLVQILAMRQINKTLLPFKQLTAREFDVFCLLAEDYSIQTIAQQLSITTKTAFNCQAQVRKKLNLRNQQHIVEQAKNYGLVNK